MLSIALLGINLVATLVMCGVILFIHVVHYPMFDDWERENFHEIERRHQKLTSFVVGPLMAIEALTTVALFFLPPPDVPSVLPWLGLFCVCVWTAVTAGISVPIHEQLAKKGFDARLHRLLVRSNFWRLIAWWGHGIVCVIMAGLVSFARGTVS